MLITCTLLRNACSTPHEHVAKHKTHVFGVEAALRSHPGKVSRHDVDQAVEHAKCATTVLIKLRDTGHLPDGEDSVLDTLLKFIDEHGESSGMPRRRLHHSIWHSQEIA